MSVAIWSVIFLGVIAAVFGIVKYGRFVSVPILSHKDSSSRSVKKSARQFSVAIDADQSFNLEQDVSIIHLPHYQRLKAYHVLKGEDEAFNAAIEKAQSSLRDVPNDVETRVSLGKLIDEQITARLKLNSFKHEVLKLRDDSDKIILNTQSLQLAKYYFDAGDLQAARAVFDEKAMERALKKALGKRYQTQKKRIENSRYLENLAEEWLFLARLTAIDYELGEVRFAKTSHFFQLALKIGRRPDRVLAYAHFLHAFPMLVVAEELYKEVIDYYRDLSKSNPSAYQPELAFTLNKAGLLIATDAFRTDEAVKLHQEALCLYRRLAQSNSPVFQRDVALTLTYLISLFKTRPECCFETEQLYAELCSLYLHLAKVSPWDYQANVATILNNFAVFLCRDMSRQGEAEKLYRAALAIYRRLARQSPGMYQTDVAMTLNNLANLVSYDPCREEAAIKLYTAAVDIYRMSVKFNHAGVQPRLANALGAFGYAYYRWGQISVARPYLLEATTILQPYAEQRPHLFGQKCAFIMDLMLENPTAKLNQKL